MLVIDLRNIGDEPKFFSFILEKEWWPSGGDGDQIMGFEGPFNADVEVYRVRDKYILKGALEGSLTARCDRCLEPFGLNSHSRFETVFASPGDEALQEETELGEEDLEVHFVGDEKIDLGEILREQIYLSLPVKSVCRRDCRGLCAKCGVNLNEGQCQCRQESGHPGFAKLKNLRIQGE